MVLMDTLLSKAAGSQGVATAAIAAAAGANLARAKKSASRHGARGVVAQLLLSLAPRGAGVPGAAMRAVLALATLHGCMGLARHVLHLLHALFTCGTRHFFWAGPLQFWHITATVARVAWRRLRGEPLSRRWSIPVEFFVEATRPREAFTRNWEDCITPTIRMLTLLDYHGETWARLFHPRVRFEFQSQGCPRPLTWVWLPDRGLDSPTGNSPGVARVAASLSSLTERSPPSPGETRAELVILFLHGGGYWAFTGKSHLEYVARIVKELSCGVPCSARACVVDTRRAPEFPWPAPVEDAVACYDWLQKGCGYQASQIVLAGDSAGGGLCLCLLLALRDAGKELPLCAMVVSPLTDLSRTEDEYPGPEALKTDFLPAAAAVVSGRYYAQGEDTRHPLISPKYGELHALPPVLVQAGEGELLARDSIEYARRLEAYGGSVKLEMYPEMPHIFPVLAPLGLEDAHLAVRRQAKFVRRVLTVGPEQRQRGPKLRILVHNNRTHSFEDIRGALGDSVRCPGPRRLPSASSSPGLQCYGGASGRRLREALYPPEVA